MSYTQQQAIDAIQAAVNDPDAVIAILGDLAQGVTIPESVLTDAVGTMSTMLAGKTSAVLYSGGSSAENKWENKWGRKINGDGIYFISLSCTTLITAEAKGTQVALRALLVSPLPDCNQPPDDRRKENQSSFTSPNNHTHPAKPDFYLINKINDDCVCLYLCSREKIQWCFQQRAM